MQQEAVYGLLNYNSSSWPSENGLCAEELEACVVGLW